MHSRYVSWSRQAFLVGIVLAVVLVVPAAWFPFQLLKLAAFGVAMAVAALLFVVGGGARDLLRTHGFLPALGVLALPLVYFVSSRYSVDPALAFSGYAIETDTIIFTLLAALAFLLSVNLFRTLRTARTLVTVVFWTLVAAAAFQIVAVLLGTPFATFADRSVNLVGKWNDLGLLCALLALLVAARVELSAVSPFTRTAAWVGGAGLIVLLALINFPVAWGLLLAGCLLLGGLVALRRHGDDDAPRALPWYSLAGGVLSIIFLLFGSGINTALTSVVPVSSLEVRPSLSVTLSVAEGAREGSVGRALIGMGPNTFGEQWLMHKPADVNKSPFWNLDFNVGYSTLATALLSVGLLGALAWLVPLGLLLAALVRAVRLDLLSRDERMVAMALSLGGIFLMIALAVYVPSQNLIILAFVLSGAAFGFLWRQGRSAVEDPAPTMLRGIAVLASAAALLLASTSTGFVTARRAVAQTYTGAGFAALSAGKTDDAVASAKGALRIESTADANRLRTDAGVQRLLALAQDTKTASEEIRTRFTTEVEATVPAGQAAILAAPQDYRGYLSLARVYDLLASLKVEGAYPSAKVAYQGAAQRNPASPSIPLAQARLEAGQGNAEAMTDFLKTALTLKPDYTDAILFTVQLNVANNDLASAIQNTTVAVRTAPGVPSIWFELGLLYYAGGDAKNAIPALEQALVLVPNYANAKYYLGLAYYAAGRTADAQKQFEDLVTSNPDNAEVKTILANIKLGAPALQGEPSPTDRTTAPIQQ